MLEQVLGANRVITRVAADLDFAQVKIAEDTYDPDSSVVRSQQRSIENADKEGAGGARGNPDAPVNLESKLLQSTPQPAAPNAKPGAAPDATATAAQKGYNRQRETVNYEINHVNRNTVRSPGTLKKLSVAVVVDGAYEMRADKDGKPKPTFVGRTPEELKSVEEMVKKAMGFDEARGDQVSVSNTPFATDLADMETSKPENQWVKLLKTYERLIVNLVLALLVFTLILSFMRKLGKLTPQAVVGVEEAAPAALPATAAEEMEALMAPETGLSTRKQIAQLVERRPERAAEIIRAWLREEV
jgi:flagellar M-ring protein FliF